MKYLYSVRCNKNVDETLHQYFIRLKTQAKNSNFHDTEREIKQQIDSSEKYQHMDIILNKNIL